MSSLFLYLTATVTLLSPHLRFRCRPLFFTNPKRLCCFTFFKSNRTALLSCISSLPHSCGCALFTYIRPPQFYLCPFSSTTLSLLRCLLLPVITSTFFCRRPSLPTAQPRLCCLHFFMTTTSATFGVILSSLVRHRHHPHNFLVVLPPHQGANVIFHRCHHNFIVVLSCSPTYHSYWYVIFPLPPPPPHLYCRLSLFNTLPQLSCLSSFTAPSLLCCLLISSTITTKKLQKSCLRTVNPVTVLAKVLVYFVFLLHWYIRRCGIPVVIMGETGCGKTSLIRFMCGLQSGPGEPKNMLLMKVRSH